MAAPFQFTPKLTMVVDLAIEHDPYGIILIRHWLTTAADVDDTQSPMAEANGHPTTLKHLKSVPVRSAMLDRMTHGLRDSMVITRVIRTGNSDNCTHL
jgi:hypothetical protein